MQIQPLEKHHIDDAARLFVQDFACLRHAVPALPARMADPTCAAAMLDELLSHSAGVAAFDGPRMLGYLSWWIVDNFRNAPHRASYVPEWGHAAAGEHRQAVFQALYRAAAAQWRSAGCHTHAISFLADDAAERDAWFWNGFGLAVVDAIRPVEPIHAAAPAGYTLRRAAPADAPALAELEAEHVLHYTQPPTLMYPFIASDAQTYASFIDQPGNFAYLALLGGEPAAYLRFESAGDGASPMVSGENSVATTSAYVRPAHRGRKLAPALLDLALREFAGLGYERCSVDFESFNPEAASFWPRYFTPVCFSVMRVPENP